MENPRISKGQEKICPACFPDGCEICTFPVIKVLHLHWGKGVKEAQTPRAGRSCPMADLSYCFRKEIKQGRTNFLFLCPFQPCLGLFHNMCFEELAACMELRLIQATRKCSSLKPMVYTFYCANSYVPLT